ncbi:MAG: hypothetical protein FWD19_00115 [Defluviitaleaceae bacterium]|nr:hypothetical protein [Defluviitaleaceae bacterium]
MKEGIFLVNENYKKYVTILHALFEKGFLAAYRESNTKKRRRLLPYLQAIHRRWFYSTLAEHTPFSPANLTECIAAHFCEQPDQYPVAVLRTPTKVCAVDVKINAYTAENHPAVYDLQKLVKYCTPHVDLYESGCFTDEQALEAAEKLSINDPHYASFLLELAIWLKLLKKVPSLYVKRMLPAKNSDEFLRRPCEEILRDMIDAAIKLSVCGIRQSVPMPENIFSESFIRSLLTKPLETDEIFGRVFDILGYDIEEVLEISNKNPDEMPLDEDDFDMELLSGTFVMGIVLDRFFFTPFGHFLRLIRPLYGLPFGFSDEINGYVNVCEDPEEAFVAFFAPCSSYTLTDLGLKIFDVAPSEENYFDAAELNFEQMKDSIFVDENTLSTFVELAKYLSPLAFESGMCGGVYTFRVRLESDASCWIHLQIPDNYSLEELYEEIADNFQLKINGHFSFFHDKTENRFAEYPSIKRATKSKSPKTTACESILSDLDFEHMSQMILVVYNQTAFLDREPPTIRLQLELLHVKAPDFSEEYPFVSRMSKKMKGFSGGIF